MTHDTPVKTFNVGDRVRDQFLVATIHPDGRAETFKIIAPDGTTQSHIRPNAERALVAQFKSQAEECTGATSSQFVTDKQTGAQIIALIYEDNKPT